MKSSWHQLLTPKWIIATLLVLAGTSVCIRLGIWQLDRLALRRAFNNHYIEVKASPLLILANFPEDDLTKMEYRAIQVTGNFDPDNNIVLRNQYHDSQPGYMLLTPMILSDGSAVLVERGWIPSDGNTRPADWHKYDQAGKVMINGIIRLGETQPEIGGNPDPELSAGQKRLDFWNLVNLVRIGQQVPYKLIPVFIQPDPDPGVKTPPYPYQPEIEISEGPHFGYALQWFTFASILFFGYPFFLRKQLVLRNQGVELEENI